MNTTITRRRFGATCLAAGAGAAGVTLLAGGGASASAPAAGLDGLVRRYLDRGMAAGYPAMIGGVLSGGRAHIAGAGHVDGPGSPAPDAATVFQLASVTKTLTGTALAVLHERGALRLDDPVSRHLPADLRLPTFDGTPVRLVDLATQSSGLPSLPPNLDTDPEFDLRNPYAHYSRADLVRGLRATTLTHEPGSTYVYSNYGLGMLGEALCHRTGLDFEHLLRGVTLPLGMVDTTTRLNTAQKRRKATGYDESGQSTPDWTTQVLAGFGPSTYSTTRDVLRYLRAQLAPERTVFADALRTTQRRFHTENENLGLGLAWHLSPLLSGRGQMIWHNGGAGGFSTYAAFCRESNTAAFLVCNTYVLPGEDGSRSLDNLGAELLSELDEHAR